MSVRIECAAEVDAPPEAAWDLLVDWERQQEWMLATHVAGGAGPGAQVRARTGLGPVGFVDTMVIRLWEPPRRLLLEHTGRVVRGSGLFEVEPLPRGRCRVIMSEQVQLPLGPLGRVGWLAAAPLVRAGIEHSLARFARLAAASRTAA